MPELEHNKQNIMAFYDLMFNQCRPREAIERYAGEQYIQHNPGVADGKARVLELRTRRHVGVGEARARHADADRIATRATLRQASSSAT